MLRRWLSQRVKAVTPGHLPGRDGIRSTQVETNTERGKVLVGKAGWLFLTGDTNDTVGQHTGRLRLGQYSRRTWSEVLQKRVSLIQQLGVRWLCQVAPDKESVYPEFLPDDVVPSSRRPVHELLDIARSQDAPVSYPLADLMQWKSRRELYWRTDTHWNQYGAFAAYRALCGELLKLGINITPVEEKGVSWVTERAADDLGSKLGPGGPAETLCADLHRHKGRLAFDNAVTARGRTMIFEQDDSDAPSAVVFGDSFTNGMLLFLKESFRRLVFVHTPMLIAEVVEREGPDVVLSLPIERFLIRVPNDDDAFAKLRTTVEQKTHAGAVRRPFMLNLRGCPGPEPDALKLQEGMLPW